MPIEVRYEVVGNGRNFSKQMSTHPSEAGNCSSVPANCHHERINIPHCQII